MTETPANEKQADPRTLFNVGLTYAKDPWNKHLKRETTEYHANGAPKRPRNKLSRRRLRGALKKDYSKIERSIIKARNNRLEVERLASNSHEAKRYVIAARAEAKAPIVARGAKANIDALKAFAQR